MSEHVSTVHTATVAVVGAGIAGIACARALQTGGVDAHVLERSRSVGGRMASPRLHGRPVDTGAAYFTVESDAFTAVVADWQTRGLAEPWTDTLGVHSPDGTRATSGPVRWRAPAGVRSLVQDLADGVDVELGRAVTAVAPGPALDGHRYEAVVLAMPDPQALRLLGPDLPATRAQLVGREWEPVIAVAVGAAERTWGELAAMFVNDHPVLSLVADDGARRGDGAPVLVAHTTSELAAQHLDDPDAVLPAVLAALPDVLGVGVEVAWTHVHRWSFARPTQSRTTTQWCGSEGVGLCGDGWGRSKVETAWLSGAELGAQLVTRLRP